ALIGSPPTSRDVPVPRRAAERRRAEPPGLPRALRPATPTGRSSATLRDNPRAGRRSVRRVRAASPDRPRDAACAPSWTTRPRWERRCVPARRYRVGGRRRRAGRRGGLAANPPGPARPPPPHRADRRKRAADPHTRRWGRWRRYVAE